MEKETRDFESAAYAGLVFVLEKYEDRLRYHRAYKLNSKPREIDCVVIDIMDSCVEPMDNAIAALFQRHNVIEFKNLYERLNIDTVWKVISYAAQYKSSGHDDVTGKSGVDAVPVEAVTMTIIRASKPVSLLKYMRRHGYGVETRYPGIYYITGLVDMRMQVMK